MNHSQYRKCFNGGVGGWSCPCCGPRPGKNKKREARRLRKVVARMVMKWEEQEQT